MRSERKVKNFKPTKFVTISALSSVLWISPFSASADSSGELGYQIGQQVKAVWSWIAGPSDEPILSLDIRDKNEYDRKRAEEGNHDSMYRLYRVYRYGIGEEVDLSRAFNYLKRAAGKGNLKAIRALGKAYGKGVKEESGVMLGFPFIAKDENVSEQLKVDYLEHLQRAANEEDDIDAVLILAKATGKGVKGLLDPNPLEAVSLYDKALTLARERSQNGDSSASMHLAKMYEYGNPSLDENAEKQFEYYKLAAEQGDPEALYILALIYSGNLFGFPEDLVQVDFARAAEIYEGLVARGDRDAMFSYAGMLSKPKYNMLNLIKARELYLAGLAQRGHDFQLESLAEIEISLGLYREAMDHLIQVFELDPHPNRYRLKSSARQLIEILSVVENSHRREYHQVDEQYLALHDWYVKQPSEVKSEYAARFLNLLGAAARRSSILDSGEGPAQLHFRLSEIYSEESRLKLSDDEKPWYPALYGVEKSKELSDKHHEAGTEARKSKS